MNNNPENKQLNNEPVTPNTQGEQEQTKQSYKSTIVFLCVLGGILAIAFIYGLITKNLGGVMSTVGSVVLALLVLLVMITVHELGHYVAGKVFGFGITEFALGFGPAIYKRKRKNGEYFSIRALPFGGFCAFEGEDEESQSPTAFNNRKPWQRIIVLVAGAAMNFLLALVFIILLFGIYGQSLMSTFEVVKTDEYLYSQSLESEDVIIELNGKSIYLQTDMISALDGMKAGDEIPAEVYRDGKFMELTLTLRADVNAKNSTDISAVSRALGVAQLTYINEVEEGSPFKKGDAIFRERTSEYNVYKTDANGNVVKDETGKEVCSDEYLAENRIYNSASLVEYLKEYSVGDEVSLWIYRNNDYFALDFILPEGLDEVTEETVFQYLGIKSIEYQDRWSTETVRLGFFQTIGGTFVYAFKIAGSIFTVFGELITGALGLNAVGGTVTTIVMTSQVIKLGGLRFLIEIAAFIGVNLAVFNLLPIPALDGSRVVFTLIEWIFKKPVNKNVEGIIHTVGLVLLLVFAVTVDLLQLF